ncbi:MAG TPA: Fe-S oxidoreductase, partial [Flavobacterium sp.]
MGLSLLDMIQQTLFLLLLVATILPFSKNVKKIIRNIRLGRREDRSGHSGERLKIMLKVAFGQTKMAARP